MVGRLLPAAHHTDVLVLQQYPLARGGRGLLRGGEDARAGRLRHLLGLGRDRAPVLRISRRRRPRAALRLLADSIKWTFWPSLAATVADPGARQAVPLAVRPAIRRRLLPDVHLAAACWRAPRSARSSGCSTWLGEQRVCAMVYASAFALNIALCVVLIPLFGVAARRSRRDRVDRSNPRCCSSSPSTPRPARLHLAAEPRP